MLHEVGLDAGRAEDTFAAAALRPVGGGRHPLDIAAVRERNDHIFLWDQVFFVEFDGALEVQRGPAGIAVLLLEVAEVVLDQQHDLRLVLQEVLEVGDALDDLLVLLHDLVALEAGEAAQPHIDDGLRLALRQLEALLQALLRGLLVLRLADRFDDGVQVVEGDLEAFQEVRTIPCALEFVPRPTGEDIAAMIDVMLQQRLEVENHRPPFDQRQRDHAESGLQGGVLVQIVEDGQRSGILLQLDDDAHTLTVGLVVQVRDAFELSLAHQLRDTRDQRRFVDHVWDLGDDDPLAAVLRLLEGVAGTHDQATVTGAVGGGDPLATDDDPASREVRSLDQFHQVLGGGIRMVYEIDLGVADLGKVVRWNVGRHADGDARGAVEHQVRQAGGQHEWLLPGRGIIVAEVDGILLEVDQQFGSDRGEPRLGVPVGGRRVAVDRPEVALAVDQRVAQREVLRHAHQAVVDGHVAGRVVVLEHLRDDGGALLVAGAGRHPLLLHRVKDPAVNRFQAVASIGQRPADDDAHRVVHVARAHLVLELQRQDGTDVQWFHLDLWAQDLVLSCYQSA